MHYLFDSPRKPGMQVGKTSLSLYFCTLLVVLSPLNFFPYQRCLSLNQLSQVRAEKDRVYNAGNGKIIISLLWVITYTLISEL